MTTNKKDQIITYIKWRINSGIYKPNKKIPSEAALANIFDCARATVRKALIELKDENYIVSRKSIGYFVSMSKNKLTIKPQNGKGATFKFGTSLMEWTPKQVICFRKLGIDWETIREDFDFKFFKTYLTNDFEKPFLVIQSVLNTKVLKNIDESEVANSVSGYLSKQGIFISSREEIAVMVQPEQHIRVKLNSRLNEWLPAIFSIMKDADGVIIELAVQYYIPSEFEMRKEIKY